jgi:acetyl-CoA C-acetyltransferase/acetyl-CoA acyltransferase
MELGLTDPICGLIMGSTAEVLARDFHITRTQQDKFALESHQKATAALKEGRLAEEIIPVPVAPRYESVQEHDNGPRFEQSMEALAKLRPYFEKLTGTVTAGNSSQITDGAAATLLMRESRAKELGLEPLGYLREFAYAGLEAKRMGLGPVYAASKVLDKTGLGISDFDLFEINEAFAAQVIANEIAFGSKQFAQEKLGRSDALGEIPHDLLNVNGGAIALGHPVGATGTRLVITTLKELRRRQKNRGLATLCIGGGQGAALVLEVE